MNLFQLLKKDHDEVEKLLERLKDSSERAAKSRKSGLEKLHQLLIPHMEAEEEVYYQALVDVGEKDVAFEGMEEHRAARAVLSDLEAIDVTDERWKSRVKVLGELILHHVEEEESEMFDKTREQFDDQQIDQLGDRVQQRKRKSMH